jgi:hypothetical protein
MWLLLISEPTPRPLCACEAECKLQRVKSFAKKCSGLSQCLEKAGALLDMWLALIAGYGSLKTTELLGFAFLVFRSASVERSYKK